VILEAVFVQPLFGDGPVFLGTRGEKGDDMAFFKPFISGMRQRV